MLSLAIKARARSRAFLCLQYRGWFSALLLCTLLCFTLFNGSKINPMLAVFGWAGLLAAGLSVCYYNSTATGWCAPRNVVVWFELVFVGYLLVSPHLSTWAEGTRLMLWNVLPLPVGFLLWYGGLRNSARLWRAVFACIIAVAVLVACWAIGDYLHTEQRVSGPFMDLNGLGAFINLSLLPLLAYYCYQSSQRAKARVLLGLECIIFILLAALFASFSRGSITCYLLLMPLVCLVCARAKANTKRAVVMIALLSVMAYGVIKWYPSETISRPLTTTIKHDPSYKSRLHMWQSMLSMYKEHPYLGIGIGTYKIYYWHFRSPAETISSGDFGHNDYLQFLTEGGPVLLLFLLLQLAVVCVVAGRILFKPKTALRPRDALGFGLLAAVLALFMQASINFIFYIPVYNLLAGLYLAEVMRRGDFPPRFSTLQVRRWLLLSVYMVLAGVLWLAYALDSYIIKLVKDSQMSPVERLERLSPLLPLRPDSVTGHQQLGDLYYSVFVRSPQTRRQFASLAIDQYNQVIDARKVSPAAYLRLAELLLLAPESLPNISAVSNNKDPLRASEALLKLAIFYRPAAPMPYYVLARSYLQQHKPSEAMMVLALLAPKYFQIPIPPAQHQVRMLLMWYALAIAEQVNDEQGIASISQFLALNDPDQSLLRKALQQLRRSSIKIDTLLLTYTNK